MADVFLEIIVNAKEANAGGIRSRDEIEDSLEDALSATGVGEVTGGGGGSGVYTVDVEVAEEEHLDEALAVMRRVLRRLTVPPSTVIKRHKPKEQTFPVYV